MNTNKMSFPIFRMNLTTIYRTSRAFIALLLFFLGIATVFTSCSGDAMEQYKEERTKLDLPPIEDKSAPIVSSATAINNNTLKVIFNEDVDSSTAIIADNYYVQGNNRVSVVSSAMGDDAATVILTTTTGNRYGMRNGKEYTLLVQRVSDIKGNSILNDISKFTGKGTVVAEVYYDNVIMPEQSPFPSLSDTSPQFRIAVSGFENSGAYSWSLDDSAFSSEITVSNQITLSSLNEGFHTLKVIAKNPDNGEWQEINDATIVGFTVDITPPQSTLLYCPPDVTTSRDINIIVGGNGVTRYVYSLDGSAWSAEQPVSESIYHTSLIDGNHILRVKGIDEAGNIQQVDTVHAWRISSGNALPVLSNLPAAITRFTSTSITVGGKDVYYYRYKINSSSWTSSIPSSEPIVINNMADGHYTLIVKGSTSPDNPDTESESVTASWAVDTIAPVATISNLPYNPTSAQSTHIVVSSDNNDVVQYRYRLTMNGTAGQLSGLVPATQPLELTALPEGIYSISVMGIDNAGNQQPESSATKHNWSIDTTPPRAALNNAPDPVTNSSSISISVNGPDTVAYKYRLSGEDWSAEISKTQPIIRTNLTDGYYTVSVIARDEAGNWQSLQDATELTWQVDTEPPVVSLSDKPSLVTNAQNVSITVGGVGVYYYRYRLCYNSGTWTEWSEEYDRVINPVINLPNGHFASPFNSNLVEGTYSIEVEGLDRAGNRQTTATQYSWTVSLSTVSAQLRTESLPPRTNGNTNTRDINIIVDGVESYQYRIDHGSWIGGSTGIDVSSPVSISNLSQGYHILEVIGKSAAGLWQNSSNPTIFEWTIDTVAPVVSLSNYPASPTASQNASFKVSGIGVYSYKYSVDNDDPRGSTEILLTSNDTVSLTNLGAGTHSIYIIGRDDAGNWQDYSEATTYTWQIDTSVPVAEFVPLTLPANPTNITVASINVAGTGVVAYKYKINSGSWSGEIPTSTPITRSGLAAGSYTISIIGKNSTGTWQAENTPTQYSWVIDTTAPTGDDITLTGCPNSPTAEQNININVTGSGLVSYMYKINSSSWAGPFSISVPIIETGLADNLYLLSVIASDAAGNWTAYAEAATFEWKVDSITPVATITNRPDKQTNTNYANFVIAGTSIIEYRYSIDGSAWSTWRDISQNINLSGLTDGSHAIRVCGRKDTVTPAFEQTEINATSYTWVVDTVAPSVNLSGLPLNGTTDNSINISVSGSGVVAYRYRLNGGSWVPSSAEVVVDFPITVSGLSVGQNTIEVIGRDAAFNWNTSSPETYTWTIQHPPLVSPAVSDGGETTTSQSMMFSWMRPGGTADVKIQIASDSSFNNIILGGTNGISIGNTDFYIFTVTSTEVQQYYARVSVNDSSGKNVDDPSWKSWGLPSNGIRVTGGIAGRILNPLDSQPVTGATITIQRMDNGLDQQTTTTDSYGNFAFTGTKIGTSTYKLLANKSGFMETSKNNITVALGEETNIGNLFLLPSGLNPATVKGQTVDANTAVNLGSVTVRVYDSTNQLMNTKTSGTDGSFTTDPLQAGVYSIVMSKAGYFDLAVDNVVVYNTQKNIGRQAMCEVLLEPQVRVIMLWGVNPKDLDLHLVGPTSKTVTTGNGSEDENPTNRFHIWYRDAYRSFSELTGGYISGADISGTKSTSSLVQDHTASYGPESINIFRYGGVQYARGVYTYTVHNYSLYAGSYANWGSEAITMRIYDSQGMVREINFPANMVSATSPPQCWKAVKITINGNNRSNRSVRVINQFDNLTFTKKASMDW